MTQTHNIEIVKAYLNRPITLIGMMGSGKSTLGLALAERLAIPFFDSDAVIEDITGKTVAKIFNEEGEKAFRQYEKDIFLRLINEHRQCIIAAGGGSVTLPTTGDIIFNNTIAIWIEASLLKLVQRTAKQKTRPLLQTGNPEEILQSLLEKRTHLYAHAPIHIKNSRGSVARVRDEAIRQLAEYLIKETP